jgi:hypothetical protein
VPQLEQRLSGTPQVGHFVLKDAAIERKLTRKYVHQTIGTALIAGVEPAKRPPQRRED